MKKQKLNFYFHLSSQAYYLDNNKSDFFAAPPLFEILPFLI